MISLSKMRLRPQFKPGPLDRKGLALRMLQWTFRSIQGACAVIILAIYTYALATMTNHKLSIRTYVRAVEGIAGFAMLYVGIAVLLLCCVAGRPGAAVTAMFFDFAFAICFIYVAAANKVGSSGCTGTVDTFFGSGNSTERVDNGGNSGFTKLPTYGEACKLQSATLALAIIALFFFIFSLVTEVALGRNYFRNNRLSKNPDAENPDGPPMSSGALVDDTPVKPTFWSRLFGRKEPQNVTEKENMLPEHPTPSDVTTRQPPPTHGVVTDLGEEREPVGDQYEQVIPQNTPHPPVSPVSPGPQTGFSDSPWRQNHEEGEAFITQAPAANYSTHAGPYGPRGPRQMSGDSYNPMNRNVVYTPLGNPYDDSAVPERGNSFSQQVVYEEPVSYAEPVAYAEHTAQWPMTDAPHQTYDYAPAPPVAPYQGHHQSHSDPSLYTHTQRPLPDPTLIPTSTLAAPPSADAISFVSMPTPYNDRSPIRHTDQTHAVSTSHLPYPDTPPRTANDERPPVPAKYTAYAPPRVEVEVPRRVPVGRIRAYSEGV